MKKRFFFLFAGLLGLALAASAPTVVEGPVVPWRVQCDLAISNAGVVTSAAPQVFYRQIITINGTEVPLDKGSVAWDSVATKDETITITLANGTTATTTRGAVLAAVIAIAAGERTAQAAP